MVIVKLNESVSYKAGYINCRIPRKIHLSKSESGAAFYENSGCSLELLRNRDSTWPKSAQLLIRSNAHIVFVCMLNLYK